MKKLGVFLLVIIVIFAGCSPDKHYEITSDDIVEAYKKAGYTVWNSDYDRPGEFGEIAYIKAEQSNGDYIYFQFFESEEAAKEYKNEYYHPVMTSLFAAIYSGNFHYPRWELYGHIVAQYDNPDLIKPMEELLKIT